MGAALYTGAPAPLPYAFATIQAANAFRFFANRRALYPGACYVWKEPEGYCVAIRGANPRPVTALDVQEARDAGFEFPPCTAPPSR